MSRYTLQQASILLDTGRALICQQLREVVMIDKRNRATRAHTRTDRLVVELKLYQRVGPDTDAPHGKTVKTERVITDWVKTDRRLRYIATRLGHVITTDREAANDAIH